MGKPWKGPVRLTSGNRHTWRRKEPSPNYPRDRRAIHVLYVNPDRQRGGQRGLRELIHGLSHLCHRDLHPRDADHSSRQAYVERDMVSYAIDQGFLEGSLKRDRVEQPKPDVVRQRYDRMVARRDKWAGKLSRAKKLHTKAEREVRDYERRHGSRVTG